jgi:hypothetical protein
VQDHFPRVVDPGIVLPTGEFALYVSIGLGNERFDTPIDAPGGSQGCGGSSSGGSSSLPMNWV